jgi:hypothetical protein
LPLMSLDLKHIPDIRNPTLPELPVQPKASTQEVS